jgi:chromosome segregation ATPase
MAPKRASTAPGKAGKKQKKDPTAAKLVLVSQALEDAEQLPASTRSMLSGLVASSLGTYADVRHEFQAKAVNMIGEALEGLEAGIQKNIEAAQTKVDGGEEEKASRAATKTAAEEALATLEADVAAKKEALKAAEEAAKAGKDALKKAEKAVLSLAPELEESQEEVVALKAKLEEFKTEASACFTELKERSTPPPEPVEPEVPVAAEEPPAAPAEEPAPAA